MKLITHRFMKISLPLFMLGMSFSTASAQSDIAAAIRAKFAAQVSKLEESCASELKKYCSTVTPGEGRMLYCMQAHEDKISAKCAFDLEEAVGNVQALTDSLNEGIIACKPEITGVCGKVVPGEGRIAACLLANKSTASKTCIDAIQKVESLTAQ